MSAIQYYQNSCLSQKVYKRVYKKYDNEAGTLYNLRTLLKRGDVNGDVKSGKFECHSQLLLLVGEVLICEQFMEFLQLDSVDDKPSANLVPDTVQNMSQEEKEVVADSLLSKFLDKYGYGELSSSGLPQGDGVYNYCNQVAHFALHLMNLNDMAKEGDVDRAITNVQYNSHIFHSHSLSSKYYHQCLDFLLKITHTLSPQMAMRSLDSLFVNEKGGPGVSKEGDLLVELSIKTKKGLIRLLKSNKHEESMQTTQKAAEVIGELVRKFDKFAEVPQKSGRHTKASTPDDILKAREVYRKLRPFRHQPGRSFKHFRTIAGTICGRVNLKDYRENTERVVTDLFNGKELESDEPDERPVVVLAVDELDDDLVLAVDELDEDD